MGPAYLDYVLFGGDAAEVWDDNDNLTFPPLEGLVPCGEAHWQEGAGELAGIGSDDYDYYNAAPFHSGPAHPSYACE